MQKRKSKMRRKTEKRTIKSVDEKDGNEEEKGEKKYSREMEINKN